MGRRRLHTPNNTATNSETNSTAHSPVAATASNMNPRPADHLDPSYSTKPPIRRENPITQAAMSRWPRLSESGELLVAVDNSTHGEVVGGELDAHAVAGQDSDVVHPHLSTD